MKNRARLYEEYADVLDGKSDPSFPRLVGTLDALYQTPEPPPELRLSITQLAKSTAMGNQVLTGPERPWLPRPWSLRRITPLTAFLGLVLVSVIALAIVAGIALSQSATASTPPLVVSDARILYMAPASLAPSDDTPGSFVALQGEGVTVLHDFKDLKHSVEQSKPDAIILHALSLPSVDRGWVASQYRDGVIIVAINVPMIQLIDWVDDPSLLSTQWPTNWYRKPFYSYAGTKIGARNGIRASGNNNINDQEGNLNQFLFTIKLAINDFRSRP